MRDERKKYMSIDFDILDELFEDFSETEIKELLYAAALYDLTGEKRDFTERAFKIAFKNVCVNIDTYTSKAVYKSDNARKAANAKHAKAAANASRADTNKMTLEEMDAEIDLMFPRQNKKKDADAS